MANNDNNLNLGPFDPMFSGLEIPTEEGQFVPNDSETRARGGLECDFGLAPSATVGALTEEADPDILDLSLSDGKEHIFDEKEVAAKDRENGVERYIVNPMPATEKPRCSSPGKILERQENENY